MQKARIPRIVEVLYPGAVCRIPIKDKKPVYLTFDDGPVPEATPMVLDILKKYKAKATFFCVGDNVKKHPDIFERVKNEGHTIGNHTFNHEDGWKRSVKEYTGNVSECAEVVHSNLFRPPYGRITLKQYKNLKKTYRIILWDVLSMDYDKELSAEKCLEIVKKYTRPGSIIVFHDSIKAMDKMPTLLPQTLEFLKAEGYSPETITATE
ncbi:MAG TPA: polysaccharide deacetylase family protein [Bacteroidia bacterium]|jgi:peptidoglycan/xylan/chitin deacetylase (PgdA/CDA1 family)|nr:polysaccharide deacetylase family protein [Bacteroidia bacterium]